MAEFSVVAVPLLFLGFLVFEASRWYVARQAVTYALFEAARKGTVSHASPHVIWIALMRGLTPLHAGGEADLASAQHQVEERLQRMRNQLGMPALRLQITSPNRAHFDDFADTDLAARLRMTTRVINNNYQYEHHQRNYRSRFGDGKGPRSGQTLFDANVLTLQITYLHMPLLPGTRQVLQALAPTSSDGFLAKARQVGALVIQRDISMPMQSHPVEFAGTSWVDEPLQDP